MSIYRAKEIKPGLWLVGISWWAPETGVEVLADGEDEALDWAERQDLRRLRNEALARDMSIEVFGKREEKR